MPETSKNEKNWMILRYVEQMEKEKEEENLKHERSETHGKAWSQLHIIVNFDIYWQ